LFADLDRLTRSTHASGVVMGYFDTASVTKSLNLWRQQSFRSQFFSLQGFSVTIVSTLWQLTSALNTQPMLICFEHVAAAAQVVFAGLRVDGWGSRVVCLLPICASAFEAAIVPVAIAFPDNPWTDLADFKGWIIVR
jgi:hypothetical protein